MRRRAVEAANSRPRQARPPEHSSTQPLAGIHSAGNRSSRRARFEIAFVHLLAQFVRCAPSLRRFCLSAHLLLIQRDPAARVRGPCLCRSPRGSNLPSFKRRNQSIFRVTGRSYKISRNTGTLHMVLNHVRRTRRRLSTEFCASFLASIFRCSSRSFQTFVPVDCASEIDWSSLAASAAFFFPPRDITP